MPQSIYASFQGTAAAFQTSLSNEPLLILAALITVYIVLGVLYESYIHPITIISTLPSAGVGALLALMITKVDFSVIALIGIILLIGIVQKNAIMMIDFALQAEREEGKTAEAAIFQACLLRFRPIIMTTMAALLGGLPLALGGGVGAELRLPLGITIVGGLIFSQMLTLFTTPVVYLYFDRLATRLRPRDLSVAEPQHNGKCGLGDHSDASIRTIHQTTGSNFAVEHGAAHGGRSGLHCAARGIAAGRGYAGDRRRRRTSGRESGDDGIGRGDPAGTAVWPNRRRQPDDIDEFTWFGECHASVRH